MFIVNMAQRVAREYNVTMLRTLLTKLSRSRFPYEPLITVEISRSRLLDNLNEFRKLAPKGQVAPVLKSNAYGHGLINVAQILENENWAPGQDRGKRVPFFIVDSYYEAVALRAQGIRTHILIIGYTRPETIRKSRGQNTAFTVTSLDMLKQISDIKYTPWDWETGSSRLGAYIPRPRTAHRIHLKIDTGMHRQGILPEEIKTAIEIIQNSSSIILEGICSHLSDADNVDDSFTDSQINIWSKAVKQIQAEFPNIKYIHLSNTDGHRFVSDIHANVSRLGIGLYGLSANPLLTQKMNLKPVLEMKTIISGVKKIKSGDHVGYSNTFTATKDMTIATIPVGYYEGVDRRLSNKGVILVGKERVACPIIGRVSMNITTIDISKALTMQGTDATLGDRVVVMSNETTDPNSIISIAKNCDTISYEIVVKIPEHLRRVVVG
jgi:alanine racemase